MSGIFLCYQYYTFPLRKFKDIFTFNLENMICI